MNGFFTPPGFPLVPFEAPRPASPKVVARRIPASTWNLDNGAFREKLMTIEFKDEPVIDLKRPFMVTEENGWIVVKQEEA